MTTEKSTQNPVAEGGISAREIAQKLRHYRPRKWWEFWRKDPDLEEAFDEVVKSLDVFQDMSTESQEAFAIKVRKETTPFVFKAFVPEYIKDILLLFILLAFLGWMIWVSIKLKDLENGHPTPTPIPPTPIILTPTNTPTPGITPTFTSTATPTTTPTPKDTPTPSPTHTPIPTATPKPLPLGLIFPAEGQTYSVFPWQVLIENPTLQEDPVTFDLVLEADKELEPITVTLDSRPILFTKTLLLTTTQVVTELRWTRGLTDLVNLPDAAYSMQMIDQDDRKSPRLSFNIERNLITNTNSTLYAYSLRSLPAQNFTLSTAVATNTMFSLLGTVQYSGTELWGGNVWCYVIYNDNYGWLPCSPLGIEGIELPLAPVIPEELYATGGK